MPKMKTQSGAAKRFRKTAKGYKHRQSFRNHILTKKSTKRKRHLRNMKDVRADAALRRAVLIHSLWVYK